MSGSSRAGSRWRRRRPTAQLVYEEAPERGLDAIQVQDRSAEGVQSLKSLQSYHSCRPRSGKSCTPSHTLPIALRMQQQTQRAWRTAKGALAGTY